MIAQLLLLSFFYGILFSAGLSQFEAGNQLVALAMVVLVPVARVAFRFAGKGGGYWIYSKKSAVDSARSSGRTIKRDSNPFFFWLFIVIELAIMSVFAIEVYSRYSVD